VAWDKRVSPCRLTILNRRETRRGAGKDVLAETDWLLTPRSDTPLSKQPGYSGITDPKECAAAAISRRVATFRCRGACAKRP
jgi:hypothetical protein